MPPYSTADKDNGNGPGREEKYGGLPREEIRQYSCVRRKLLGVLARVRDIIFILGSMVAPLGAGELLGAEAVSG